MLYRVAQNVRSFVWSFTSVKKTRLDDFDTNQLEVKLIWQKAPHGGPIPQLGVTPGGQKLYHWIPGIEFPISVQW